jgi:cell fate (sporulation/competence/biofilm development) regulator YlbF (YheA/YmcA/DUF963 family)
MTKDEIISQANQLGQAIADSNELLALKIAQQQVTEDMDAYRLVLNYQQARARADSRTNQGLSMEKEDEEELVSLENQIEKNELVQGMLKAQEEFDNIMQAVNFVLSQAVMGDSCGGSCGSCGGSCC